MLSLRKQRLHTVSLEGCPFQTASSLFIGIRTYCSALWIVSQRERDSALPLNNLQRRAALSADNIPMADPSSKAVQTISDALAVGIEQDELSVSLHSNLCIYSGWRKRTLDLPRHQDIADSTSIYESVSCLMQVSMVESGRQQLGQISLRIVPKPEIDRQRISSQSHISQDA